MRKYFGILSIIILILTILIMQFFVAGKVSGPTDMLILMIGVGLAILTALLSEKGRLKTIVLSLYAVLAVVFISVSIIFAVAHM
ncbi:MULTISPECIES: hypothetical protein [Bacillaceae]|uniref:DUF3953 domain-containing protein n=1 Tax=Evansella alkalicola TaxID=745819 RepID=A0ABS6JNY1_9BACI|nr:MULTISPECIES: hypothetical protein [Bacillaceae]MBU9720276.1 hypothetical protein [Bacillus alkalicola]